MRQCRDRLEFLDKHFVFTIIVVFNVTKNTLFHV